MSSHLFTADDFLPIVPLPKVEGEPSAIFANALPIIDTGSSVLPERSVRYSHDPIPVPPPPHVPVEQVISELLGAGFDGTDPLIPGLFEGLGARFECLVSGQLTRMWLELDAGAVDAEPNAVVLYRVSRLAPDSDAGFPTSVVAQSGVLFSDMVAAAGTVFELPFALEAITPGWHSLECVVGGVFGTPPPWLNTGVQQFRMINLGGAPPALMIRHQGGNWINNGTSMRLKHQLFAMV